MTEFKPFNLTRPKPKVLPQPEAIKREIKRNPVPKNHYKKSLQDIEREKEERRQEKLNRVKAQYEGNIKQRFDLETEKRRPDKKQKVYEEVEAVRQAELQFNKKHARKMPDFDKKEAVVKLNTAAVLREGHHLKKEEKKQAKILKDYEMNLRDDTEFNRLRFELEEKDEIEHLEHIQKMKIEMELAREEAILAQQKKLDNNKVLVTKMKIEAEVRQQEREDLISEDKEQRKAIVEAVQSQKDKAAIEVAKVKEEKKKIRDDINKEISEAMQRKKEEDAIEQRKKEELIR